MSQLYECKINFDYAVAYGAIFTPFVPTIGTVCTLLNVEKQNEDIIYTFEELKVTLYGNEQGFVSDNWKEILNLPSIEEVIEMIEEAQYTYIPFEV